MLGLKTIRNPYMATIALALALLPVFLAPSHSCRGTLNRSSCNRCLLAAFTTSILATGTISVLLARTWREQGEQRLLLLAPSSPCPRGRAPPSLTGR